MSSRVAHFSSEDVEHLSGEFGRLGHGFKSFCGSNQNGYAHTSQNGWGNDECDDGELLEEDVWGTVASYDHSHSQESKSTLPYECAVKNGGPSKGSKGWKSWLSMEVQAAVYPGRSNEHIGVGFVVSEAARNGSKESNGGWAPGFYTRKVRIPPMEGSGYGNGWYEEATDGRHAVVPQSAPVSISVWPVECGEADADGSDGRDNGVHEESDEDDADEDDERDGRLAPHEIVDREYARSQSTTFSVTEGAGRTLKGMDLRRVRNAVWNCTGFED